MRIETHITVPWGGDRDTDVENSRPLWRVVNIGAVGREHPADGTARFVVDSALEESGFEPSVPAT